MSGERVPWDGGGPMVASAAAVAPERLEAVKWLAFLLMVADHVNVFLLHGAYPVLYLLGRCVFPLFAFCIAFGVAGRGALALDGLCRRLLMWALIAQVPWSLFAHGASLNVLFQLWAGVALYQAVFVRGLGKIRIVLAVLAVPAAMVSEFGIAGLLLLFGALWWAESKSYAALTTGVVGLLLLYGVNATWFALFAPVVFLAALHIPEVPRWRHAFYALYPGHFVLLALARWLI